MIMGERLYRHLHFFVFICEDGMVHEMTSEFVGVSSIPNLMEMDFLRR